MEIYHSDKITICDCTHYNKQARCHDHVQHYLKEHKELANTKQIT